MDRTRLRQIVVFALIFFNMLILFDWIQFGVGPPVAMLPKLASTAVATVFYGGLTLWLHNRKNRRD